jgi:hypothetical protein
MVKKLLGSLRPVDWIIAGYQLIMCGTALFFGGNIPNDGLVAWRHASALLVIVLLRLAARGTGNTILAVVSDWYPAASLPLAYRW